MGLGLDGLRCILYLSGRDAGVDARLKHLVGRHDSPGCDDGAVRHDGVVHHDGSHADDHVIADHSAVHIGTVSDRHIIAYDAF